MRFQGSVMFYNASILLKPPFPFPPKGERLCAPSPVEGCPPSPGLRWTKKVEAFRVARFVFRVFIQNPIGFQATEWRTVCSMKIPLTNRRRSRNLLNQMKQVPAQRRRKTAHLRQDFGGRRRRKEILYIYCHLLNSSLQPSACRHLPDSSLLPSACRHLSDSSVQPSALRPLPSANCLFYMLSAKICGKICGKFLWIT
jgi:hypothetical protein